MPVPQQRMVARHQRILDAALDVFNRHGYRDAGVDDIAAASDTSKGGVYFHFPSKQAIFLALLDRAAAQLLERAEEAIAREQEPVAKADAALRVVLHTFASHRQLARLFLVEAPGAGREFQARLAQLHGDVARLIQRHLDDAAAAGAVDPVDTSVAARAWFGAINEVVVSWLLTRQPQRLEDAYPALRALLLRSVGARVAR